VSKPPKMAHILGKHDLCKQTRFDTILSQMLVIFAID